MRRQRPAAGGEVALAAAEQSWRSLNVEPCSAFAGDAEVIAARHEVSTPFHEGNVKAGINVERVFKSCRVRNFCKMNMFNYVRESTMFNYVITKIGFDPAESGPSKV